MKSVKLTAGEKVRLARDAKRPISLYYIDKLFENFVELKGDRLYGNDGAIVGGIGLFNNMPVTIIAQAKGRTIEDNIKRNFGMSNPEGYRKALRLAKQAAKFKRPIITFVDTPGAYPGVGAEERGQAESIARNLMIFMEIPVPIISIVIGEGGSGGALALTVSDYIAMLENSIYSVLSPEGFSSILWKDSSRASEAAELMKLTAKDLLDYKIIDEIIKEPKEGIHLNPEYVTTQIRNTLETNLKSLMKQNPDTILQNRYEKFRKLGKEYV